VAPLTGAETPPVVGGVSLIALCQRPASQRLGFLDADVIRVEIAIVSRHP
jgi:hypothetical protein